jgi:hypothetical protein
MDPMPLDDGGKLRLKMVADIYLFKPSIGSVLKGMSYQIVTMAFVTW